MKSSMYIYSRGSKRIITLGYIVPLLYPYILYIHQASF
jgi:hypothetical protein